MLTIGDFEIHIINDAKIHADWGGVFGLVPKVLWSRHYELDDQGQFEMHHKCLFVKAGGRKIVVDTGIGTKTPEKMARLQRLEHPDGGLLGGLAKLGVTPDEIDLVIDTHLHSDHCGGNTYLDDSGNLRPTFPNAEYWVQRFEYADAAFPNERTRGTYFAENFVPLYESGQLKLIDGEVEVLPGIHVVPTPGHTRGHTSITFEQGDQAALYVADMASLWVHFAHLAWMTAYDVEPLVTLETKRFWQRWVLERDALVLFEHDPVVSAGRLVEKSEGKYTITPVPEAEPAPGD